MDYLMTVDVESYSFETNSYDYTFIPPKVTGEALPPLLELFRKNGITATFFFTARFAQISPKALEVVLDAGHEIGSHGYSHEKKHGFDILSYKQQLSELKKSKKILEDIAGEVLSFRSPSLRINNYTILALEDAGFLVDSSVSSQRFDGPMSFGFKNKINWFKAPRKPYTPSREDPFKKGDSSILELPVSALLIPYIGTFMRIFPGIFHILEQILFFESKKTGKPMVFLTHPQENMCAEIDSTSRRSENFIEYLMGDLIRHRLKMKNLGEKDLQLIKKSINAAKSKNFRFLSVKKFHRNYNG